MGKIAVLIGTRPGIIKMSPLVHELRSRKEDHIVIHTGQHYSDNMDAIIQKDVGLEFIDYTITRPEGCDSHARQTAYMLVEIENILMREAPEILLVCGDANTNFAGALAARKIHVKVGHVEAGLRSFDWRMPEEHNRVMIDHISDYLFAPTNNSRKHLLDEKVKGEIYVVGNTIVDSTLKHTSSISPENLDRIRELAGGNPYILLTMHREENVDNPAVLGNLVEAIREIAVRYNARIIFPMHPRTKKRVFEFQMMDRLEQIPGIKITEPMNYKTMLAFIKNARMVMTDSGGLQEEACILKVPCITLRDNTERPETVDAGANRIAGTDPAKIVGLFDEFIKSTKTDWTNPFGDGRASERIIDTCLHGQPRDEFVGSV